jgi:hypothetical protein
MAKTGGIPTKDRQAYRADIADDVRWRRPKLGTAELIWARLETWDWLPSVRLGHLLPKRGCTDDDIRIAKQSLVVVLDCAISTSGRVVGHRDVMLTKNVLFDALAARWSRQYRQARRTGARVSYDMKTETVVDAIHELALAGIRFNTLWQIVAGPWSQSGSNRLFSVRRRGGTKGHALGYRVDVNVGSTALAEFEAALEADGQYRRRRPQWPLLLADDPRPRRPIRQKVCAEQPYNTVHLGKQSKRVLSILERTRVDFNVQLFRQDYEARLAQYLQAKADSRRDRTSEETRQYRKLTGFVARWRRLYRQTETSLAEPLERIDEETWIGGVPERLWIRSRFFRGKNRRYHASNFWPEHVQKEFRERWFSLPVYDPGEDAVYEPIGENDFTMLHDRIPPHMAPGRYVERDVVTSQIQTLAVFLGIEELETLATADLKGWLADRIWTQHLETPGGLLEDGYEGKADRRLVAFVKAHLMHFYGGALNKIVRSCGTDEPKYGPGWKTTRGLWAKPTIKPGTKTVVLAKSGVAEAAERAEKFLLNLPSWTDDLYTFLEACRELAETSPEGAVLHDPLEKEIEVRWNPAQRGTTRVGHEEIEVRPWGKNTSKGFVPLPAGTIDGAELRRFVAPCLTHMLDSYFSSLVLQGLRDSGVTGIVALHDCWLVPEALPVPGQPAAVDDGAAVLERAIEAAGEPWLLGLRVIYDDLVESLGNNKTFGPFVHEIRTRWQTRVAAKRWPKFLAH